MNDFTRCPRKSVVEWTAAPSWPRCSTAVTVTPEKSEKSPPRDRRDWAPRENQLMTDFPNGNYRSIGPNRRVVHSRGTLPGDRTRVPPALDRPCTPLAAARSDAGPNPEARQLSSGGRRLRPRGGFAPLNSWRDGRFGPGVPRYARDALQG